MANRLVYVEIDPETGLPIRILKHFSEGFKLDPSLVSQVARKCAVECIRSAVIKRATRGKLIHCELCGNIITEFTGEMHEVIPKGMGGEVSVDNSHFICNRCHTKDADSEHGDRRFQSSKIKESNGR